MKEDIKKKLKDSSFEMDLGSISLALFLAHANNTATARVNQNMLEKLYSILSERDLEEIQEENDKLYDKYMNQEFSRNFESAVKDKDKDIVRSFFEERLKTRD